CAHSAPSLLPPPSPVSTVFPYTTLFRSPFPPVVFTQLSRSCDSRIARSRRAVAISVVHCTSSPGSRSNTTWSGLSGLETRAFHRSEEHTSELQSHLNLVCRLLLEKKTDR